MRSVELKMATESLAKYIQVLGKEPLLVNIKGTPVAVLTPIADLEGLPLETHLDSLTLQKFGEKSDCAASLADCVRSLEIEPAIATYEGKPVAVLVAIADVESVSLSNNPRFLEIIDRSRRQQKEGKVMSSEEVRRKLGLG